MRLEPTSCEEVHLNPSLSWDQEAFGVHTKEKALLQLSSGPYTATHPPEVWDPDFKEPQDWGQVLLGSQSAFWLWPHELLRTV